MATRRACSGRTSAAGGLYDFAEPNRHGGTRVHRGFFNGLLEVFGYEPRHDIAEAPPKLSQAFPSPRFILDWDEADGYCGRCIVHAGKVTASEILPWDGNDYVPPGEVPSTLQTIGCIGYAVDETDDPPDNWAPFSRQRRVINGPRDIVDAIVKRLSSEAEDDREWFVLLHRLVRTLEFMPDPVARRVEKSRHAWLRHKLARAPSLGIVRRVDRNAVAIEWRATRRPREDIVRKLALAMPECGIRYEWEQVHAKRTGRVELHGAEEIYRGEMPLVEFICCPRPQAKRYFVRLISGSSARREAVPVRQATSLIDVAINNPKSGSYPAAGSPVAGLGGPMTGAMRSLM